MTEQEPNLADKDEVIEASRKAYGTPRAEVERMIYKQMGLPSPEEQERKLVDRLYHQLQGIGMSERQAKYLIARYPMERIERQLRYLPFRRVYSPSGFIVAAVRHNYQAPEEYYADRERRGYPQLTGDDPVSTEHDPNTKQEPNEQ